MPFAAKPMTEEDELNKQQGSGVNVSGAAPVNSSTGLPGQDAGAGNKPQKSSGNYANIQSYLDANKTQGDQMGQTIASNVDQKATDAQNKIQGFSTKAPTVQAYDPNSAYSKLGTLTDSDKQDYRNYRTTGGYSGPDSVDKVDGYADTQKAASEASSMVKNTTNEMGQQALLKEQYKRPKYSAGENRLDQVLLQNSEGSKQALQNVGSKYAGIDKLFQDTTKQVGDSVTAANQQALANKKNVLSAEEQQWQQLINPIQVRAEQANRDAPQVINSVRSDIGNEDIWSDEIVNDNSLAMLGLDDGMNLYDRNLNNYLNTNETQYGINDVADATERQKYQALADLIQDPSRNQITADGKKINPVSLDRTRLDSDLKSDKDRYASWTTDRTNLESKYDQLLAQRIAAIQAQNNTVTSSGPMGEIVLDSTNQQIEAAKRMIEQERATALNENDLKYKIDYAKNNQNRRVKKG